MTISAQDGDLKREKGNACTALPFPSNFIHIGTHEVSALVVQTQVLIDRIGMTPERAALVAALIWGN